MTVATQTQTQTQTQSCYRCGGSGIYRWGTINNGVAQFEGVCFRCNGSGKEAVKTQTAPAILKPEVFKVLDNLGQNVGRIAKTEPEAEVRRMRDLLDLMIREGKESPYYAPNVYVALQESIDRVIEIRFGATAPTEVEEVDVPVLDTPNVPVGTYTVEHADGSYFTVRVQEVKKGALKGRFVIQGLVGPDNGTDFVTFGFVNANPGRLTVNVWKKFEGGTYVNKAREFETVLNGGDLEAAGIKYALTSTRCRRCNRVLTVATSIHQGYGPDCIDKV